MTVARAQSSAALVLVAAAALAMTGCSGSSSGGSSDPTKAIVAPTGKAPAGFGPVKNAPAGFQGVSGPDFSLQIPPGWQHTQSAAGATPSYNYRPKQPPAGRVLGLGVVREQGVGVSPADQQSFVLQTQKEAQGVKDFKRSKVDWPGAQSAYLNTWTEPAANGRPAYKSEQLMVQVNDKLVMSVVALGSKKDFAQFHLETALRTFAIASGKKSKATV